MEDDAKKLGDKGNGAEEKVLKKAVASDAPDDTCHCCCDTSDNGIASSGGKCHCGKRND